jgi:hypothetical protein
MHRSGVLLACVALLVAGCGSSAKGSAGTVAPTDHGDITAQRATLTKALARFKAAGTGRYESEVTADGVSQALANETGTYDLQPVASQFERAILGIDERSRKPRVQVVRTRSTADHRSFLQLKEWGSWSGCWLPMDLAALSKQTGIDVSRGSTLPTAIGILAGAEVTSDHGLAGPHLGVDAYSALQFLGVASSAISSRRAALTEVSVPVLLDVTPAGGPSGAAVEGAQVAAALTAAGLTLGDEVANYVAKAHAEVVLSNLGEPVSISAPPTAELLANDAPADSTCPANE